MTKIEMACYVVKVGGSITTNKEGKYDLNGALIENIATVVMNLKKHFRHPLILVFGGGSFGNVAPNDYSIRDSSGSWQLKDLPMMSVTMLKMLNRIAEIFRDQGVSVYPFHTSSIVNIDIKGNEVMHTNSIRSAIELGLIPILCGDLVFDAKKKFTIYSSDNIPVLLGEHFDIKRALYYSNVDGIYFPFTSKKLLKEVTSKNYQDVLDASGPSAAADITGGMKTKILAIYRLSQLGVVSEILSIKHFPYILDSLENKKVFGTEVNSFI